MKDMKTDINIICIALGSSNQELDLIAKTVMRKKDSSSTQSFFEFVELSGGTERGGAMPWVGAIIDEIIPPGKARASTRY